ncbi:MAG TPA: YdiU family protein [Longimicrobiales bacterium]
MSYTIPFDTSYARLPERFYARTQPTPVTSPRLVKLNVALAGELGLDPSFLSGDAGLAMLSGNALPGGAAGIATAYAGHQFGGFVPQLGDGRAILIGEIVDRNGIRRDIQLKGGGPTRFSRGGDGRAAIGPVLREYIISEAMQALGIPTTRALAAVTTGQVVLREGALPGAVLTRVASSHIRVGTFQYFAARGDDEAVRLLADHVIARHYPDAADASNPYRALLDGVVRAQGELIAQWLLVGFIHGVMNTDNCSVAGETIDYGPCAFLDEYDPRAVFSSIDRMGRYAYGNQPAIGEWNVARFAECLLPLISDDDDQAVTDATESLTGYADAFERAYRRGLRHKIGLLAEHAGDVELAQDLLNLMASSAADFTSTFRRLSGVADTAEAAQATDAASAEGSADAASLRELFADQAALSAWLSRWHERLQLEPATPAARAAAMRAVNPAFVPRNHRVEETIRAATEHDDFGPFERLMTVLSRPFEDHPENAAYATPPSPEERVTQTFCGT